LKPRRTGEVQTGENADDEGADAKKEYLEAAGREQFAEQEPEQQPDPPFHVYTPSM
jgi:hypothetical protein